MHRPIAPALFAVLLALPACDTLVPQTGCESEMTGVRLQHGIPDQVEEGVESQIWIYNPPENVYFEFDWSTGECRVTTGPASQRSPLAPVIDPRSMDDG